MGDPREMQAASTTAKQTDANPETCPSSTVWRRRALESSYSVMTAWIPNGCPLTALRGRPDHKGCHLTNGITNSLVHQMGY